MKYKAISLKQPWANLIAEGKKTIETRKWKTSYRGKLLICSSQSPKIEPYGKAVCIVNLYDIKPMSKEHETKACCKVYPNAYSWFLKDIKKVKKQFPVKGRLNIYEIDVDESCL